jgi:outer membrane protein OmpA-like peptidoglycan-associated protein
MEVPMKRLNGTMGGILAAGFIGFLTLGNVAFAEQVSRQQIVDALTAAPKLPSLTDRLGRSRSMTFDDRDYAVASTQSMPAIDLEVYFDFNSAEITARSEPQLRELGDALSDPKLKGATISINGHTDAMGSDAYNKRLSERRAAAIKVYLVENFRLAPSNLRTVGYGKSKPKNRSDLFAAENRRVEVVNLAPQAQAQR